MMQVIPVARRCFCPSVPFLGMVADASRESAPIEAANFARSLAADQANPLHGIT